MEGGYLVGKGTYGCVFDPPLLCEKEARRKRKEKGRMLGKLTKESDYQIEEDASIRIQTIPNHERYFVAIDTKSLCRPKPIDKQKDSDIWKCTFLKQKGYDMTNMIHFRLKYGGVDSYDFICSPREDRSCSQTRPAIRWQLFLEGLLEAGATLTLYQLVHYDIHRVNILIDEKTSRPRLIDFGQAFYADAITTETLAERWKEVVPGGRLSEFEPPEVTMATLIRKGLDAVEAYGQIIRYKEPLQKAEVLIGLSRERQGRDFAEFWRDSGVMRNEDWVRMFQFYWPTIDAWNIGAVLLHLFEYCQMRNEIAESKEFREAAPRFKELLRGLLRLNPKRRLDCIEALHVWNPENEIVQGERGQTWLETRATQRASTSVHAIADS